jgi:flagellin-like hook-associated protein FlgL
MAKYTDADIRQQAAVAVMSQGNMSRRAILALFT